MKCFHPFVTKQGVLAPCGKCLACLSRKQSQWVTRLEFEMKYSSSVFFFTLTYDDTHLPRSDEGIPVVFKRDVQLFLKRLRKRSKCDSIRYFICSEYGPTTLRPHYHGIIFNFPINLDIYETFLHSWQQGFTKIDSVTPARLAYVGKYCVASQLLPKYLQQGNYKPFMLCSRKPGIGFGYITDNTVRYHCEKLRPYIVKEGGIRVSLPRYYREKIFDDSMKQELFEQSQLDNFNYVLNEQKLDLQDDTGRSLRHSYHRKTQEEIEFSRRVSSKIFKSSKL